MWKVGKAYLYCTEMLYTVQCTLYKASSKNIITKMREKSQNKNVSFLQCKDNLQEKQSYSLKALVSYIPRQKAWVY